MPRLLELFKGTGSVGRAFEALGWDVISLDIDPKANATYTCDILDFDCQAIDSPVGVIWASPSCTKYSAARTKGSRRRSTELRRSSSKDARDSRSSWQSTFVLRKPLHGPAQEPGHNRIANAKSRLLCLWLSPSQAHGHMDRHRLGAC